MSMLRGLWAFCALGAGLALDQIAMAQGLPRPKACLGPVSEAVVAGIEAGGDLRLAGGGVVRMVDVRLPDEPSSAKRPLAFLETLVGQPVRVSQVDVAADRWGRLLASVGLPGASSVVDLSELLVGEGFARVSTEARDALCRPDLLAIEAAARGAGRGLWTEEAERPLPADDLGRLTARVGHFALVEGRVRSVGERASRTYLNFGAFGVPGFTVTIPKRAWSRMQSSGMSSETLRGRRVRVRGILEEWRGVAMEITAPAMLEMVEDLRP